MATGRVFCSSRLLLISLTFLSYSGRPNDFSSTSSDSVCQPTKSGSSVAKFSRKYQHSSSWKQVRHLASATRGRRYLNSRVRYYANSDNSFQQIRLFRSGDVSLNPGPNIHKCSICARTVARNHRALSCDSCTLWCHINCGNVNPRQYKLMQLADDICWTCPRCLLSTLPFADVSNIELVNHFSTINSTQTTETMAQLLHFSSSSSTLSTCSSKPASGSGKLRCLLANARSLKNKLLDFQAAVYSADLDIIAVTETWLTSYILDHEILPTGYQLHRKDRQDRQGGGILFASRSDFVVFRRNDLETDCELMWNELQTVSGLKFLFGTFYRPPNTGIEYMLFLQESCFRINNLNFNKIFLVGDFNLPNFDWTNQIPLSTDQLLYLKTYEIINDLFLTQVNTSATRDKNILDLVLTSTPDLVTDLSLSEGFLHSDHLSLSFSIFTKPTCTRAMPKEILNFKKADMDELKKTLSYIPWHVAMLDDDINMNVIKWEDLFWAAVNEFVPRKRVRDMQTPPWIDSEVKALCRKKDKASRRALKTKNQDHIDYFKSLRRKVKKLIHIKYTDYLNNLADSVEKEPKKLELL